MSGSKRDERGGRHGQHEPASAAAEHGPPSIAPGKVTRTSKLEPAARQAVQRKPRAAGPPVTVRPIHAWIDDPNILAAHGHIREEAEDRQPGSRAGAAPAVQRQESEDSSLGALSGGARLGHGAPPPLPEGVPPLSMSDRHVLTKLKFFKAVKLGPGAGNSYLLPPLDPGRLQMLYREAIASGMKDGPVKLSNGQIWYVNRATGKFFPMAGKGIIELTQQEVRLLEMLVRQIRSGKATPEQALQNLGRAMSGQRYTISHAMEQALEVAGHKLGIGKQLMTTSLAAHAPASRTMSSAPEDLRQAARTKAGGKPFRLLRWGGRILLVVAIAADAYEVYEAENKPKTITKKAGAWAGSLAAGGAAAETASPLLGGGPWGWAAYGVIVAGAGGLGYLVGGEVTETIYEWGFEEPEP